MTGGESDSQTDLEEQSSYDDKGYARDVWFYCVRITNTVSLHSKYELEILPLCLVK